MWWFTMVCSDELRIMELPSIHTDVHVYDLQSWLLLATKQNEHLKNLSLDLICKWVNINDVCNHIRMYEYIAFDFHLPFTSISFSGTPVEYLWVAQPMRDEWDLNVEVSKPKNLIVLCKTDVNWYNMRNFKLRWQKWEPWLDGKILQDWLK